MIRVGVVGATGLIGGAAVQLLAQDPRFARPITITRRPAWQEVSDNHCVDFAHLGQYRDALNVDVVFSCLGTTRRQAGSIAAQRIVDVDYQLEVASLAREAGVEHFCLVSSSGADAKSANPYLQMKGELEQAVRTLGFPRLSIFQPSLLLGTRPDFRLGERIGAAILPLVTLLPGLRAYRPIAGAEVARRMIEVAAEPGSGNHVWRLDEIFMPR